MPVTDPTNVFIQWKGTDVCLDFWCACGFGGHFDGSFAYYLRCDQCGAVYKMPTNLTLEVADKNEIDGLDDVIKTPYDTDYEESEETCP